MHLCFLRLRFHKNFSKLPSNYECVLFLDGDWKVWVSTETSASDAIVTLIVFGDEGNSGPIILGEAEPNALFQANNIDEFKAIPLISDL